MQRMMEEKRLEVRNSNTIIRIITPTIKWIGKILTFICTFKGTL